MLSWVSFLCFFSDIFCIHQSSKILLLKFNKSQTYTHTHTHITYAWLHPQKHNKCSSERKFNTKGLTFSGTLNPIVQDPNCVPERLGIFVKHINFLTCKILFFFPQIKDFFFLLVINFMEEEELINIPRKYTWGKRLITNVCSLEYSAQYICFYHHIFINVDINIKY